MAIYALRVIGNGVFPDGTIHIDEDVYILDALEQAGYDVPYSSRVGADPVTLFLLVSGSVDSSDGSYVPDELRDRVFEGENGYEDLLSKLGSSGDSSGDLDGAIDGYISSVSDVVMIDGVSYHPGDTLPDGATLLEPISIRSNTGGSVSSGGSGNTLTGDSADDFFENWGVLYSSGINITHGVIFINPNTEKIQNFVIPVRPGMALYSTDTLFYHDYDSSVSIPLDGYEALRYSNDGLKALEQALISNPTPGDDGPASINGTVNDVGNLGPIFDGDDNFVYSFIVDNKNANQSDIIVNYTINGEHVLANGYVARMVQRSDNTPADLTDADYSYSLVTFGEGDAFIQGVAEWPAKLMADAAWYQNSLEIFSAANESLH